MKIRMNLENESLFFLKEGMISGIDHHLLFFFVMFVFMIHYVVRVDMKKPFSLTAHFANLSHG